MATFLDRFFKRGKKVRKFVYLGMFIQPFVKIPCWWYQDSCFNRPTATPTNCRGKAWSWHLPPTPAMMLGTQSFHLNGWLIYLMHQINYSPLFFMRITQYRNSHSGNANCPTRMMGQDRMDFFCGSSCNDKIVDRCMYTKHFQLPLIYHPGKLTTKLANSDLHRDVGDLNKKWLETCWLRFVHVDV